MSDIYNKLPYEELAVDSSIGLRQLVPDHAELLFKTIDDNREYLSEWLPWVGYNKSPVDSEEFIKDMISKRQAGLEYGYGIFVDRGLKGHSSLMHLNDDKDPEIGYWISKDVSGRGITTKVAGLLTNFGLNSLKLEKIVIKADVRNIASNRVAEKLGYVIIGTHREDSRDINTWSISK